MYWFVPGGIIANKFLVKMKNFKYASIFSIVSPYTRHRKRFQKTNIELLQKMANYY